MSTNLDQFPWTVLVFRKATKETAAEVLFNDVVIAPSREIATLLAAFQLDEKDQDASKLVNIEIKVSLA